LGIAGLAPLASHSFATAQKSNQKRPPLQLRPVKSTGFPFRQHRYHAAPELAKNAQTCWHRKPMITAPPKWLVEVEGRSKEKQNLPKWMSVADPDATFNNCKEFLNTVNISLHLPLYLNLIIINNLLI